MDAPEKPEPDSRDLPNLDSDSGRVVPLLLKTFAILAVVCILFAGLLSAARFAPVSFWHQLDLSGRYIWLPDMVANFFDGKSISLHFHMGSGEVLDVCGTVRPSGSLAPAGSSQSGGSAASLPPASSGAVSAPGIHSLSWAVCPNADYDVSMGDLDALELATSTGPIRTFDGLMKQGRIRVQPSGADNRQRFEYARSKFPAMDGQAVPESIRKFFLEYKENGSVLSR